MFLKDDKEKEKQEKEEKTEINKITKLSEDNETTEENISNVINEVNSLLDIYNNFKKDIEDGKKILNLDENEIDFNFNEDIKEKLKNIPNVKIEFEELYEDGTHILKNCLKIIIDIVEKFSTMLTYYI